MLFDTLKADKIVAMKERNKEKSDTLGVVISKAMLEKVEKRTKNEELTEGGTIIRTAVDSIPVYGRSAAGVIVMRVTDGQACAGFTTVPKAEEEDAETEEE